MHLIIIEHARSAFYRFHPVARAVIGLGLIALLVALVYALCRANPPSPAEAKRKDKPEA
jgi:hypothetical protein